MTRLCNIDNFSWVTRLGGIMELENKLDNIVEIAARINPDKCECIIYYSPWRQHITFAFEELEDVKDKILYYCAGIDEGARKTMMTR